MCTKWFEMIEERMSGGGYEFPLLFSSLFPFPPSSLPSFHLSPLFSYFIGGGRGSFWYVFLLMLCQLHLWKTSFLFCGLLFYFLHSVFDKQNDLIKLVKHFRISAFLYMYI